MVSPEFWPDLTEIIAAWPELPEQIKWAVKILIETYMTVKADR